MVETILVVSMSYLTELCSVGQRWFSLSFIMNPLVPFILALNCISILAFLKALSSLIPTSSHPALPITVFFFWVGLRVGRCTRL